MPRSWTRSALPMAALAAAAAALAALAALALLAAPASAGGTGAEVGVTPIGAAGGGADADLLRLGASSDAMNIYLWLKVGADSPAFAPIDPANHAVSNLVYPVDFTLANGAQYYADNTFTTASVGGLTDVFVYPGNSLQVQRPAAPGGTAYTASWVCNELRYTIPRSAFAVAPADGDVWTGMMATSMDDGANAAAAVYYDYVAPGPPVDQPPGTGSWTVGDIGFMWQDEPTIDSVTTWTDNTVRVSWTPAPDNGAQPTSSYTIYRRMGTASFYSYYDSVPATQTFYIDDGQPAVDVNDLPITTVPASPGLANNVPVYYKVAARSCPALPQNPFAARTGESILSLARGITPNFKPEGPASIAATLPTLSSLTVSWPTVSVDCPAAGPACTDADPAATPTGVTDYELWGGYPFSETVIATIPASACATQCTYVHSGLFQGTTYCYFVAARDGFAPPVGSTVPGPNRSPLSPKQCASTNRPVEPAKPDPNPQPNPLSHEDSDMDGLEDATDNCADVANNGQVDLDRDGRGDACDDDRDGDTVEDAADDCPTVPDPLQLDDDSDGAGDACQNGLPEGTQGIFFAAGDQDGDGVPDGADDCVGTANGDQLDVDKDLVGDACDADADGDGILDLGAPGVLLDNCVGKPNHDQLDSDGDGLGDACDRAPKKQGCVACTDVEPDAAAAPVRAAPRGEFPWVIVAGIVLGATAGAIVAFTSLRRRRAQP